MERVQGLRGSAHLNVSLSIVLESLSPLVVQVVVHPDYLPRVDPFFCDYGIVVVIEHAGPTGGSLDELGGLVLIATVFCWWNKVEKVLVVLVWNLYLF